MESCSLTIQRTESDSNLTSSIPQNRILEAVDVPAGLFFLRVLEEHSNRAARTGRLHLHTLSRRDDLSANRCFMLDEERDVLICPAGRELAFRGLYRTKSGGYRRYQARGCPSCSFYGQCVTSHLVCCGNGGVH